MKSKKDLTEKTIESELVFQGHWLKVQRDKVLLPDGGKSIREYVLHPGAALMIPVLDDGRLVMIEQYRHPLKRNFLEFPAGKIDHGETSLQTAHRELREEVGAVAKSMQLMTRIHPVIGYGDEFIDLYMAKDLTWVDPEPDEGEILNIQEISFDEAFALLRQGQITDVKTSLALFWYEKILNAKW